MQEVTTDEWQHAYSRTKAAYPLSYLKQRKFWATVHALTIRMATECTLSSAQSKNLYGGSNHLKSIKWPHDIRYKTGFLLRIVMEWGLESGQYGN